MAMSQTAWETTNGMRGYAGSPAQIEDRRCLEEAAERTRIAVTVLRAHGYRVAVQPAPGCEYQYSHDIDAAARRVMAALCWLQHEFKVRGKSQRALKMLHDSLPEPAFGVLAPKGHNA